MKKAVNVSKKWDGILVCGNKEYSCVFKNIYHNNNSYDEILCH